MSRVKKNILILMIGLFPEASTETLLLPLFPYMLQRLRMEHIGYYSGLLGSAFYLSVLLTSTFWGTWSDSNGSKRVLLLGISVHCVSVLFFSFGGSFPLYMVARTLAGLFGANSNIVKSSIGSFTVGQDSMRTWGYSMYGALYGVCGFVGPILGDILTIEANDGLFHHYPYLLVGIVMSSFGLVGFLLTLFFYDDTRPRLSDSESDLIHDRSDSIESIMDASVKNQDHSAAKNCYISMSIFDPVDKSIKKVDETSSLITRRSTIQDFLSDEDFQHSELSPSTDFITNPSESNKKVSHIQPQTYFGIPKLSVMPIILYSLIALCHMVYAIAFPLFFASSKNIGGFELSAAETGKLMSTVAITKLIVQLTLFPFMISRFGIDITYRFGIILLVPVFALLPFVTSVGHYMLMIILGGAEACAYLSIIMKITSTVEPERIGFIHGMAATCAALIRTLAPTIAGVLWEAGVAMHFPAFVCLVSIVFVATAFLLSFKK